MKNSNNSMLMSGPIEVLIKTKWYKANAAISEHYRGISLDEEQPDGLWQVRKKNTKLKCLSARCKVYKSLDKYGFI